MNLYVGVTDNEWHRFLAAERARMVAACPVSPRLGEGAFRVVVTETYGRRCAVTGQ